MIYIYHCLSYIKPRLLIIDLFGHAAKSLLRLLITTDRAWQETFHEALSRQFMAIYIRSRSQSPRAVWVTEKTQPRAQQVPRSTQSLRPPLPPWPGNELHLKIQIGWITHSSCNIYFTYQIHRFIKESYGRAKQTGTAYVKVKLEDDIELPREANRQYIY